MSATNMRRARSHARSTVLAMASGALVGAMLLASTGLASADPGGGKAAVVSASSVEYHLGDQAFRSRAPGGPGPS